MGKPFCRLRRGLSPVRLDKNTMEKTISHSVFVHLYSCEISQKIFINLLTNVKTIAIMNRLSKRRLAEITI